MYVSVGVNKIITLQTSVTLQELGLSLDEVFWVGLTATGTQNGDQTDMIAQNAKVVLNSFEVWTSIPDTSLQTVYEIEDRDTVMSFNVHAHYLGFCGEYANPWLYSAAYVPRVLTEGDEECTVSYTP